MALYSKVLSAGGGNYRLDLTVNQSSQSVANNTSSVSWSLVVTKTAGSGYWSNNASSWNVNIGGQKKSGTIASYDFRGKTSISLGSGSFTIAHNADGTKSIAVSGYFSGDIGSGTASGNLGLTTIPRASSFGTISGSTLGSAITVNINRASSSFTHSLWYSFGSATWQGIGSGIGTSTSFTPPLTLGSQIPNATSGTLTLILRTMNGSTQIGGDVTKSITVTLPSSVVPSFTAISHSEYVSSIASTVGAYVKGFSRINLSITGASGSYGSTIKSYSISFAGHNINASSGTTGIINSNGTLTATGTITDSRGRTATKSVSITVLNYTPPQIVSASAQRTNSGGSDVWNGTYIKYAYNVKVQSLSVSSTEKNAIASLALQYKLTTASSWSTFATLTGALTLNSSNVYTPLAITSSYDVRIVLRDKLGSEVVWIDRVSSGTIMLDLGESNMGVGKFWERGTIDAVGQIYQNDGVAVANGLVGKLPAGDINSPTFWANLKDGLYYVDGSTGTWTNSTGAWHIYHKQTTGSWGRILHYGGGSSTFRVGHLSGSPLTISWTPMVSFNDLGNLSTSINLIGTAAQNRLITRGIQGSDGNGNLGELYLNNGNTNKVYINGQPVNDFIVEEGEKWQRWASGKMECWGNTSGTTDASGDFAVSFPKAFTGNIDVYITERWNSTPSWKGTPHSQSNTGFKVRCMLLSTGVAFGAGVSHTVWWSARGTWK